MWNSKRSILLSLICLYVFGAVFAAVEIFALPLVGWLLIQFSLPAALQGLLTGFIYACLLPVGYALYLLWRILRRVQKGDPFGLPNIRSLRWLSWCCFAVAAISFGFGFGYFALWVLTPLAAFVGLILRVVKNACQQAWELQQDNEMTI